uniref:Adipose-secreted signaling protein n=1 Tax=Podarcis muralis TaxID=64176 RepID=A0A670IVQ6_PODMU
MATANKGTKSKVGGVRFAPPQPAEGSSSHVHFDEKLHDSVVMVTQEKDGSFLVKVGFLKILHKYEITFHLPFVQRLGQDVCAAQLANLNLRVTSIAPAREGPAERNQILQGPGLMRQRPRGALHCFSLERWMPSMRHNPARPHPVPFEPISLGFAGDWMATCQRFLHCDSCISGGWSR